MPEPPTTPEALRPAHPSWAQSVLVAAAAFLWAAVWLPTISAAVWAYLAAWCVLGLARGRGARWAEVRLPTGLGLALCAGLGAPALYYLIEDRAALLDNAQVTGLSGVLQDRQRLRTQPTLHPPLVLEGRPQVFWIRADGADQVALQLAPGAPPHPASRIGPGTFRLRTPPQRATPRASQTREVAVWVDGQRHAREVFAPGVLSRPRRLRRTPDGRRAIAVSPSTDTLWRFGPAGAATAFEVGVRPIAAVATATRAVWVAHGFGAHVWAYDLETGARTASVAVGEGQADLAGLGPDLAVAAHAPPRLVLWSAEAPTQVEVVRLPAPPDRVVFGPDRDTLVVASRHTRRLYRVSRRAGAWHVDPRPLVLGRPAQALARRAGGRLWVAVSDHRPDDDAGPNHEVREQLLDVDVTGWRVLGGRPTHPRGCAVIVDLSPLAACAGTDRVLAPDAEAARVSPLPSPSGAVTLADGTRWVVSEPLGAAAWSRGEGPATRVDLDSPALAQDILHRGARGFFEATRSGAACATCHPETDSDHALHDIGHGVPRPTLTVAGLAGTAPFLRGASYPGLDGLDHFAQTLLGGYERAVDDRAAALEAYLKAQPPLLSSQAWSADVAGLRAGFEAFRSAACTDCHPPPAFTNLAQYPQSLLFPGQPTGVLLDTPSLLGVAGTPPYLFDGRAKTLADVFEAYDAAGRHGRFSILSPEEQSSLLRFLEAL